MKANVINCNGIIAGCSNEITYSLSNIKNNLDISVICKYLKLDFSLIIDNFGYNLFSKDTQKLPFHFIIENEDGSIIKINNAWILKDVPIIECDKFIIINNIEFEAEYINIG